MVQNCCTTGYRGPVKWSVNRRERIRPAHVAAIVLIILAPFTAGRIA